MGYLSHILSTEQVLSMYLLFDRIFEDFSENTKNHIVVDTKYSVEYISDEYNLNTLVEKILNTLEEKIVRKISI